MTEAAANAAGWFRFTQVKQFVPGDQLLYTSSAPNYAKLPSGDHDASQNLTKEAVSFLRQLNIDSVISFNKYSYKPGQVTALTDAKIDYKHFPVHDGSAPTLEQLDQAKDFFFTRKSTLVHAGYGLGRTSTGATALQIATIYGQTLEPYARTWCGTEGNQVETRGQISALAELRNVLLQGKIKDVADIDPKKHYVIINAGTGYYLTISQDNLTIVAHSPESVENGPRTRPQYLWKIGKEKDEFTLSNRVTYESFAIIKADGDGHVNNGQKEDGNNLFKIGAKDTGSGIYSIFSKVSGDPIVGIEKPDNNLKRLYYTKQTDALLFDNDKAGKYSQWIILPVLHAPGVGR